MRVFSLALLLLLGVAQANQQKVFSIADLHGDYDHFKMILERLGLATFAGEVRWTGGDSILVSTGDSVDRGEHSRPIYLAFQELARQAPQHGGEVVNLLGNHELMNLQGDLRYVAQEELASAGDYGGQAQRQKEWSNSGLIGSDIRASYKAAAVRAGTLFVHGGLDPDVLNVYGSDQNALDALNTEVQKLLSNDDTSWNHKLFGANGPFWNRNFAHDPDPQICDKVDRTLRMVRAERMVVGHTRQDGVNGRCEGPSGPRIILGDTSISRAYGHSRPSAIEYNGDAVTAMYFLEGQKDIQRVPLTVSSGEF